MTSPTRCLFGQGIGNFYSTSLASRALVPPFTQNYTHAWRHHVHEYFPFTQHTGQKRKDKKSLQSPLLFNHPPTPFLLHHDLCSFSSLFSFSSSSLFSWLLFILLFFFFRWWNSGYSIELWLSWKVIFLPTISPSCLLKKIGQI